ncbi:Uncharacterised protein [Mycobacteroides abscessus subsp. abscessus]|nr:Uncharacterised protein [Mycobacteroides abscessus subsp. abscessus]
MRIRAVPASHGLGTTNVPDWWRAANATARSCWEVMYATLAL